MDEGSVVRLLGHSIYDAQCKRDSALNNLSTHRQGETEYGEALMTFTYTRGRKDAYESVAEALEVEDEVNAEVKRRYDAMHAEDDYWRNKVDMSRGDT